MADNKVKFNLKNAHYALHTVDDDGGYSYGTPVSMPGSVSLSLDANGEPVNFYADGVAYYVINNNMGYEGDLELALIPESFRTDILKEELDDNGVLIENSDVQMVEMKAQFRCSGADGYLNWVDHTLQIADTGNYDGWDRVHLISGFLMIRMNCMLPSAG